MKRRSNQITDIHSNFDDIAGNQVIVPNSNNEGKTDHFFSMLADHGRCAENKSMESLSGS